MIVFHCVNCGRRIESQKEMVGQRVACSGCGSEVKVPAIDELAAGGQNLPSKVEMPYKEMVHGEIVKRRIKLILAVCLVACFATGAIAGIMSTLSIQFGVIQAKIMLTALSLGAYSLTGLCSSLLLEKRGYREFAIAGLVLSVIGALFALITNWDFNQGWEFVLKMRFSFIVLAVAHAHASLLLLIDTQNSTVNTIRSMVLITIVCLTLILISMTQGLWMIGQAWTIVAILVIVDVFGSLSIPVMHLATKINK